MKNYYQELKQLLNKSYSPYSNFPVAAIISDAQGNAYYGVNVENASYPSGLCAERSALFGAVANSNIKLGQVNQIHILSKNVEPISPCLGCRQVMTELMTKDAVVHMYGSNNEVLSKPLSELAPYPITTDEIVRYK